MFQFGRLFLRLQQMNDRSEILGCTYTEKKYDSSKALSGRTFHNM